MSTPSASNPQCDNEIGLLDLATTFVKRRRVFYAVFLLVTLAGVAYALLAPEKYEYITLLKLAEKHTGEYVEAPASVVATLQSRWLPEVQAEFQATNSQKLPAGISFSNPKNTAFVRILSEATPNNSTLIQEAHDALTDRVRAAQQETVAELKEGLRTQIEAITSTVDILKGEPEAGAAIAGAIEKKITLQNQLQSIKPFEVLVVGRQSAEQKGPASSLIIVLSALLGLVSGIFFPFMVEFASQVKQRMSQELP